MSRNGSKNHIVYINIKIINKKTIGSPNNHRNNKIDNIINENLKLKKFNHSIQNEKNKNADCNNNHNQYDIITTISLFSLTNLKEDS